MVDQDLIERVIRLPVPARLELIELLTHSLREDLGAEVAQSASTTVPATDLAAIERLARSFHLDVPSDSSLHDLLGVVSGEAIPTTKEGMRDLITDYLIEKYS